MHFNHNVRGLNSIMELHKSTYASTRQKEKDGREQRPNSFIPFLAIRLSRPIIASSMFLHSLFIDVLNFRNPEKSRTTISIAFYN